MMETKDEDNEPTACSGVNIRKFFDEILYKLKLIENQLTYSDSQIYLISLYLYL